MRTATVVGARVLGARVLAVVAVALTTGFLVATQSAASTPSATASGGPGAQPAGGLAPGGPGTTAYMGVARKDCFGTARNTTSRVWFTVADGVLSDVFSPTIENSNVNTVQYVVTDGKSFTDLQQRDMAYTVSSPDRSGMVCRVVSTDASHRFRLVSDYITDPARDSVVVRTTLEPLRGAPRRSRSSRSMSVTTRRLTTRAAVAPPTAGLTTRRSIQPRPR